jgi:flagellar hook assembly protein FlgD
MLVRFVVYKADHVFPRFHIYDLAGRKVVYMRGESIGGEHLFRWDGVNLAGQRVAPGLYMCRVDLGTASVEDTALRSIAVVY